MSRAVHSRVLRLLVTAGLLAGLVFVDAGTSLGANSRNVFFGSPDPEAAGLVTFTPVTVGGASASDVIFRNDGPGTLNHVRLSGGAGIPATINPNNPVPNCPNTTSPCPSLPSDTHYLAVYVSSDSAPLVTCAVTHQVGATSAYDGLVCDAGQLAAGQFVRFRVIVLAPASTGERYLWFAAQLDEGSSGHGSNSDIFYTSGTVSIGSGACSSNVASVATYFVAGSPVQLQNGFAASCPAQNARLTGPADTAQGTFAALKVDLNATGSQCFAGFTALKCFGGTVEAHVYDGAPSAAGITWTIQWSSAIVKSKPKGVVHFLDDYNAVTNPTRYVVIPFDAAHKCGTTNTTNCWLTTTSTKIYFEATFITNTNGLIRGW